MKVSIRIGPDHFEADGAITVVELLPLIAQWFDTRARDQQATVDAITNELRGNNDRQRDTIAALTPAP